MLNALKLAMSVSPMSSSLVNFDKTVFPTQRNASTGDARVPLMVIHGCTTFRLVFPFMLMFSCRSKHTMMIGYPMH